jgi:hypothetical protein
VTSRSCRHCGLLDPFATIDDGAFLHSLILLMSRLKKRWQFVRLAIAAARSTQAAEIARTPYVQAITVVVNEVEDMAMTLRILQSKRSVADSGNLINAIHAALYGMREELGPSEGSS